MQNKNYEVIITKMKPKIALKNALLEIISCMLSPNSEDRRIAEERKKALEVTDEYGLHLLEILLCAEEALEERQMAAILLDHYVQNHWDESEEDFVPPRTSDFVKVKIKTLLPMGLSDNFGKIQNHIAYILAKIAAYDYPNDWPNMGESIFSRIQLNDCLGVISFINEFSRLGSNYQFSSCSEQIYSALFAISKENTKYSTKLRGEAVSSLCSFLYVHSLDPKEKQKLIDTNIPMRFCELLAHHLILPHPEESDYHLKSQILLFYSMVLIEMPEGVVQAIINILPNIWQILSKCGEMYDEVLANEISPYRDPTENVEDPPRFYGLACQLFNVLHTLLNTQQALYPVSQVLPDLIYHMILFMGIPKEVESLWKNDPDLYISDDYNKESYIDSSVRILSKKLLILITSQLDASQVLNALSLAVDKHTHLCKGKSESYYWRIMEAVMYAVGSINNYIITLYKQKQVNNFDIVNYISQWGGEIGPCPSWFMLARIMLVGGQYASLLRANDISKYVMTTIHNLRESSFILRYSAIRAISLHLKKIMHSEFKIIYMEVRDPIAHALIYALENSQGQILQVGLYALEDLLKPLPPIIDSIQNEVITLLLHLFLRNLANPEIVNDLHGIVKLLCESKLCYENLESRFLPVIATTINNTINVENSGSNESYSSAIEFLNTILKYSSTPITDQLLHCFFTVYACIISNEDCIVTQCGADCLRTYLCKAPQQIIDLTDDEGFTGSHYMLNILRYFLDPQRMELYCRQVGKLCITVIHTLGNNLDLQIGFLLKDMLSSMQRTNSVIVEESLLIIFASLFYNHLETVIYYLTLIPGPQGESALTFVLNRWLAKCYKFSSRYQCNLNVLALAKLIEHTILKQDQRVADIKVRGDPISDSHYQGETYLKCDAVHFTEIPVLLKIVKLLLWVLQQELRRGGREHDKTHSAPERLDFTKIHDKRYCLLPEFKEVLQGTESSVSDCDSSWDSDLDSIDDNNPVYNMKLYDFLSNFLKNLAESNYLGKCVQYLDEAEKKALVKIGVNIPM